MRACYARKGVWLALLFALLFRTIVVGVSADEESIVSQNMCGPNNLALVVAFLGEDAKHERIKEYLKGTVCHCLCWSCREYRESLG